MRQFLDHIFMITNLRRCSFCRRLPGCFNSMKEMSCKLSKRNFGAQGMCAGFNACKYVVVIYLSLVAGNHKVTGQQYTSIRLLIQPDLPVEWMKEHLRINDAQTGAVVQLNIKYETTFDSIRRSHANRFMKFERTYRVVIQRDNELRHILNDEQFELYHRRRKSTFLGSVSRSDTILFTDRP
jgi:hypothetical protein